MQITWHRRALHDLQAVREYIAEVNPGAARQVAQRILQAVGLLAEQPKVTISQMWTWRQWCVGLLLLGALLTSGPARVGGVDWDTLLAGKVVVETVQHPDGFAGLRASFTVAASRERIWAVLIDYANFPQIFPDITKMRVLAQDQDGAQVEFWINAMVAHYHYVLYRRYDEPGRRLTWTRVAGDFKRIEGGWEIRDTPRPDVHLLVYESYVDIGGIIPKALVRLEATRKLRAMGPRLRNWIERRPMPE